MNTDYENYIFDYYGTLLDSYNDEKDLGYWNKWLKVLDSKGIKHGDCLSVRKAFFNLDLEYRKKITLDKGYEYPEVDIIDVYRELFSLYGNGVLPDEVLYELAYDFRVATREYIRLYPGVEEYLKKLRNMGKRLFVLSNAQRAYTWPEITMFDVDHMVDGVIMSSDYGCMKPEVDLYKILFEKYGLDKATSVMIGDSISSDVAGAKAFGIDYIHLVGDRRAEVYFLDELEGQ